jgi:AraC family transcriptional regulator, ethanolamine operon transcriptional activator
MDSRSTIHQFDAGVVSSIETHDFDEFCSLAAGWHMDHQVLGRQAPVSRLQILRSNPIQLGVVHHTRGYGSQGAPPAGTVSFLVTAGDDKPVTFRGKTGGSLDIQVSGGEFEMLCPFGSDHLVTSASAANIDHASIDLLGHPLTGSGRMGGLRFSNRDTRRGYITLVRTIMSEIQQHPQLLNDQKRSQELTDRLLAAILLGLVHDPVREQAPYRQMTARRARRYIMDRLDDPPSVRELCRVSGANYATLERGFKETYGLSPRAYLKALRLAQARRDLRAPNQATTVTGVALRWGFLELGRFAGEYRRRFGESPIDTLRKSASLRR